MINIFDRKKLQVQDAFKKKLTLANLYRVTRIIFQLPLHRARLIKKESLKIMEN